MWQIFKRGIKYSSIHWVLQGIFTFARLMLIVVSDVKIEKEEIFPSTYSPELNCRGGGTVISQFRGETTAFNDQSKLERTPVAYEI